MLELLGVFDEPQPGATSRLFEAVHHEKGEAGPLVSLIARRLEADVVIVGSAGRRGLNGFLIGSTAESIIGDLDRSVLVVKPPGFVPGP